MEDLILSLLSKEPARRPAIAEVLEQLSAVAGVAKPKQKRSLAVLPFQSLTTDTENWGNESSTTLDPEDDKTFWTIQAIAVDTSHWATQITALHIEPDRHEEYDVN